MGRRLVVTVVVLLAFVSSATSASPVAARTSKPAVTHKLIVAVKRNLPPAAEKKLAVLVLITQASGPPAGAVATPSTPLTVLLDNPGVYRVKGGIDSCTGSCVASYRISGSANHKLEIVPSCRPTRSGFACSKVTIVKVY